MDPHEIDYKIYGNDMQVVEVELDYGETICRIRGYELDG